MENALSGKPVKEPVFAVYDWFVENRNIDWEGLFKKGLAQINHAYPLKYYQPNVEIVETKSRDSHGNERRDIRWITDIGELHEWYLGEWRQEYLIKSVKDYRILKYAFIDTHPVEVAGMFENAEDKAGTNGMTFVCPYLRRTAFQSIQIDYAGLERFSLDIATGEGELIELIEIMNDILFQEIKLLSRTPVGHIKLWENLSIETMGPKLYRQYLTPVYHKIINILKKNNQKLHVHYDGKLRKVSEDIAQSAIYGIDSLTPAPEGDMTIGEARNLWPDKFFWLHPSLAWYRLPEMELLANVSNMIREAGPYHFCLMISEELPTDWEHNVPLILKYLHDFPEKA